MNISVLQTGPFGVNTYIVPLIKNKVLVFDPAACSFCGDENAITDFLKENALEPVAFFLTHGHFDHITGTAFLKSKFPLVPLAVNKEDTYIIGKNASKTQSKILFDMGLETLLNALSGLPDADIVFCNDGTLDSFFKGISKEESDALSAWTVIKTPGHTKGSVCYYNKSEKIIITGDTVFYKSWGRTDFPGGSEKEMMESLNKIYSTIPSDVLVYPGHDKFGFCLSENLKN